MSTKNQLFVYLLQRQLAMFFFLTRSKLGQTHIAEESSTKLSRDLAAKAVNYAATVSDKLVPVIAKFRVRSPPFDSPYMSEATRKSMMPADWWKLLDVEKDVLETIQCILSCSPSTADLEKIFSTYSWVHSKERNRLGVEKSAKLVFVLKTLNMSR